MITIYHLGVSQSDRIVWLMEELQLPYTLEWYDRGKDNFAPPEYKALHPVATAPTIRDGDTVLCESIAIIEYIIQRHGNGRLGVSKEQPNFPDYWYWMCFSTSLITTIVQKMMCSSPQNDLQAMYLRSATERQTTYFNHLEQRLGETKYLAGDEFTAADIQNLFTLTTMPRFGGPAIDHLSNVSAYVRRVTQRPAYVKAMGIAGPDAVRPRGL